MNKSQIIDKITKIGKIIINEKFWYLVIKTSIIMPSNANFSIDVVRMQNLWNFKFLHKNFLFNISKHVVDALFLDDDLQHLQQLNEIFL